MSTTVRQVYSTVSITLMEDLGLTLGVFTEAQFLHALGVVLLDFSQRAPLDKTIYTQRITSSTGRYTVPDVIMEPQLCFIGGKLIEKVSESDLLRSQPSYRTQTGVPRQWYEDNLEVKKLQLFPIPDYTGDVVPGDGYNDFYASGRNLTIVGPAAPSKTTWAIGDTLDGIADSFTYYLAYGILEEIFSSESEVRDLQRSLYCKTRWEEGIRLTSAIAVEELMEADE